MQDRSYDKNKRIRIFAGPNGSGKSTILGLIDSTYDIGYYINADEIEKKLKSDNYIQLSDYGIRNFDSIKFDEFIKQHSIIAKATSEGYEIDITIDGNRIVNPNAKTHSYEAALLADFLRYELLNQEKKMTFETVMSHPSKLEFLKLSQSQGYKNYLYYVSTENPQINIARVEQRVKLGGHPVLETKIESRYFNSLDLLSEAVQYTYRSFIFDNSSSEAQLIIEIYNGEEIIYNVPEIPKWVDKYLFNKSTK